MQALCACDSVLAMVVLVADAVHVTLVLVRMLAVRVLAVVVLVLVVRATLVRVIAVLVRVLAVTMLVIAVFMHAVTVLVVAMRMIVFVSQVRLLVPERRHKRLAKSVAQQVAADKHTPGLFLRLVARNGPRTFYQVKLDPLITAWQRTFCSSKLSKHAS